MSREAVDVREAMALKVEREKNQAKTQGKKIPAEAGKTWSHAFD